MLESSHYGPLPQAGFLELTAPFQILKKHKNLTKFLNTFSDNEFASAELMTHLISDDLNLLEQDDAIDYPGIDQNYFDSRALEFKSLNSFDFNQYSNMKMAFWKDLT